MSPVEGTPQDSGQPNDAVLVERALRRDKEAYRLLVERYQSRVYAIAFEIVKNREDAEDIAQESFVKAYLSLASFKGDSSFFTWLYRIVHNMSLDVRRKLGRRGGATLEYDEVKVAQNPNAGALSGVAMGSAISGPQDVALSKEKATVLQRALSEISEEHRSVVVLREIDGLSYDEIARVTGVSKGTVMSRLFYARKKLQQVLHEYAPPSTAPSSAVEAVSGSLK